MIDVQPGDRVLHLGCGDGAATRDFARRASLVLGVDASDETVRHARRLAVEIDNLMFVTGSPEEVPWQQSFFTVVVSDWPRAVREIFRVSAPGARVYIMSPPPEGEDLLRAAGFDQVRRDGLRLEARKP
jgi:SAM-dependent methyltransferase